MMNFRGCLYQFVNYCIFPKRYGMEDHTLHSRIKSTHMTQIYVQIQANIDESHSDYNGCFHSFVNLYTP